MQAGNGIRSDETQWLSKYALELAVIRPEQILKRLFRAMNRQFDPAESTDASSTTGGDGGGYYGGDVYTDSDAFGTDATASDGGGDSFG